MPDKAVYFHPEALREAEAAVAWYRERSPLAAASFLVEIERAVQAVSESPGRWPVFETATRRYPLHRFPYWVIYREREKAIEVLAVAHARRRPGYWRIRKGK